MNTEFESIVGTVLDLDHSTAFSELLPQVLLEPISNFLGRPRKNIRGELVEIGYEFEGKAPDPLCKKGAELMELLHSGSLIIDDIEDNSSVRRGKPSLHSQYGVPLAINCGNWLYFLPLKKVRELGLSVETEIKIYRGFHNTLFHAHTGQAVDVGISIDRVPQSKVFDLCLKSLELKSGSLTAFALTLGAILGNADDHTIASLERFGISFGMSLQMFDDIGNMRGTREPAKKYEDLNLRRPSWIWAYLARSFNENDYLKFVECSKLLPDCKPLDNWLQNHGEFLRDCKNGATRFLEDAWNLLLGDFNLCDGKQRSLARMRALIENLKGSYE